MSLILLYTHLVALHLIDCMPLNYTKLYFVVHNSAIVYAFTSGVYFICYWSSFLASA